MKKRIFFAIIIIGENDESEPYGQVVQCPRFDPGNIAGAIAIYLYIIEGGKPVKKKHFLLLALILTIAAFVGCGKTDVPSSQPTSGKETPTPDPNSLHVLIDMPSTYPHNESTLKKNLKDFKSEIIKAGGPKDITFDIVFFDYRGENNSENYALRGNDLTRIRTEIMAGKGPDVFITTCEPERVDPVFKYPDQMMSRRAFLPLDEYIDKAQFMEWDKLIPVIMEAGKGEEGQLVLPLTYSMPITVFRASEVEHTHSKTLTLFDVAESDNPASLFGRDPMDSDRLAGVFPVLADYSTDTLAFSEDELKKVIKVLGDLQSRKDSGEFDDIPGYYHSDLMVRFNDTPNNDELAAQYSYITSKERLTLFPLYSTEGGYCATITSFAAINRNTKRPDDAFFVLDYLLSLDCQCSPLYANLTWFWAVPTHEEAMRKWAKVVIRGDYTPNGWQKWFLTNSNFDEFCSLRDNISYARFRTELDEKLDVLLDKSEELAGNEKALDREVHQAYMEMAMMLGES